MLSLLAVAATTATRNDEELHALFSDAGTFDLSFFSNTTASQFFRHFLLKGTLQDVEVLQKRLRRLLGDATFLEAFMHSGKPHTILCPSKLLCLQILLLTFHLVSPVPQMKFEELECM